MSKKASTQANPKTATTKADASRIQSAVAKENGGKVPPNSYVTRMQRAADKAKDR